MTISRRKFLSFVFPTTILSAFYSKRSNSKNEIVNKDTLSDGNEDNFESSLEVNSTGTHQNIRIDASEVVVKNGIPKSIEQNQEELNSEVVYLRSFGAKGDYIIGKGGSDDTAAFQAAVEYCSSSERRKLMVGQGCFLITETISSKPFLIVGDLGSTFIVAKGMEGKVVFDMSQPTEDIGRYIGSMNVEWIIENGNVKSVIVGPKKASQYAKYFLKYIIENNNCHGAVRTKNKYGFTWDYSAEDWFVIGDCVGAKIAFNNIQGQYDIKSDPELQFTDTALKFDAEGAVLSARISDNNLGPVRTGIYLSNRVFATIHDNDIIGTRDGILWDGDEIFSEPKIHHNNINAQRYGVKVSGASSLSFINNTIRRHRLGWQGGENNWFGYHIKDASDLKLAQNTVQSDFTIDGNDSIAYHLENCSLSILDSNFVGFGCTQGISLNNCSGINIDNTITAQNNKRDILFQINDNTRSCVIGSYCLVSTFNGIVISKDASITAEITMLNDLMDMQNVDSIKIDKTIINAEPDFKKWRETINENSLNRSIVDENDNEYNYSVVTRNSSMGISLYEIKTERIRINAGPDILTGEGDPEGNISASKASIYLRVDGEWGASLYIKESFNGSKGWVKK